MFYCSSDLNRTPERILKQVFVVTDCWNFISMKIVRPVFRTDNESNHLWHWNIYDIFLKANASLPWEAFFCFLLLKMIEIGCTSPQLFRLFAHQPTLTFTRRIESRKKCYQGNGWICEPTASKWNKIISICSMYSIVGVCVRETSIIALCIKCPWKPSVIQQSDE